MYTCVGRLYIYLHVHACTTEYITHSVCICMCARTKQRKVVYYGYVTEVSQVGREEERHCPDHHCVPLLWVTQHLPHEEQCCVWALCLHRTHPLVYPYYLPVHVAT